MTYLALDIETCPQVRYTTGWDDETLWDLTWLAEHVTGVALPEPGAERGLIQNGEGVLAATGMAPALHPTTGHLVSVAWGWDREKAVVEVQHLGQWWDGAAIAEGTVAIARYERQLVFETLDRIAKARRKRTRLVTFDGKRFDLPFIMRRAMLLGLDNPGIDWNKLRYPYGERDHCDLRMWLSNYERFAKGTQSWWAASMGLPSEDHGAQVWEWVRAGEWARIEEYGKQEMETLTGMYLKAEAWI